MLNAIKVLKEHGLRKTTIRIKVVSILADSDHAVSQPELESKLSSEADRVTLYRTMKSLEEKGVVHKIIDMTGISKYALCKAECTIHQHNDEHLHFHCSNCGNVYCLNIPGLPDYQLPAGYAVNELKLNAIGICFNCNA